MTFKYHYKAPHKNSASNSNFQKIGLEELNEHSYFRLTFSTLIEKLGDTPGKSKKIFLQSFWPIKLCFLIVEKVYSIRYLTIYETIGL